MSKLDLLCIVFVSWMALADHTWAACVATDPPVPCTDVTLPDPRESGELAGWINLDNEVVLRTIGTRTMLTVGVELTSDGNYLVPATRVAPFRFFLMNAPHQIVYGDLSAHPITAEGITLAAYDLESALAAGVNPCQDLNDNAGVLQMQVGFCTLAGDVDFDGEVTFGDFLILSDNFGKQDAVWPDGDFDWDREVGFSDFIMLSENFGSSIGAAAVHHVPEPNCAAILVSVLVVCLAVRR